MKPIVVRNQVRLGPVRCLLLTLAGMYYRLTRSVITVAIFALAVAFLSYVYVFGVVEQERTHAAYAELRQSRSLGEWITRLSVPDVDAVVLQNLLEGNGPHLDEYRRWSGIGDEEFAQIESASARFAAFVGHLDRMRGAARAALLGDVSAFHLPGALADEQRFDRFLYRLQELSVAVPLGSAATLREFIRTDYPRLSAFVARVQEGHAQAIERVHAWLAGRSLHEVLIVVDSEVHDTIAAAGFAVDMAVMRRLADQTMLSRDERELGAMLAIPEVRTSLARRLGVSHDKVDLPLVTSWVDGPKRAAVIRTVLQKSGAGADVPPAGRILRVARHVQRSGKLQQIAGDRPPSGVRGFAGMPQATRWLIVVSFLVCTVGICNTMFMSVTERFTEIATMKCLGAMDGFIMLLFVFESVIMGLVGSAAGIAMGAVLVLVRGVGAYGAMLFESVPATEIGWAVAVSLVSGVVLAIVAAAGPAWMAARLAPMEAMRVE